MQTRSKAQEMSRRDYADTESGKQQGGWLEKQLAPLLSNMRHVWVAAVLVRAVLILWGAWQDNNLVVKYTDVDYMVFRFQMLPNFTCGMQWAELTYRMMVPATQHASSLREKARTSERRIATRRSLRTCCFPTCG